MTAAFNCLRALEELQDWLQQESTPENAAALEEHLAACAPCRRHREFEERFQALLSRTAKNESCPPDTRARLVAALRKESGG